MKKYLNVIIVSFFAFLLLEYDYGLPLIIPIILIYLSNNSKLSFIVIPVSMLSIFVFNYDYLKVGIVLYIFIMIYLLFFLKKKNLFIDAIYTFVICMGLLLLRANEILNKEIIIRIIIYSALSSVMLTVMKIILNKREDFFVYFEIVSISLALIGASLIEFEYNICFYLGCFYAIYFTYNANGLFSFVFSTLLMVYIYMKYKIEYVLILPFLSVIYMINSILSSFVTILLTTILCFIFPEYYKVAIILDVICIAFELLKNKVLGKRITKENEIKESVKESSEVLNRDVLAFSSFLDMCAQESEGMREYYKKLDEGIKSLEKNYCNKCYLCNKCYQKDVKEEMKNLIINAKNITYDIKESEVFSVCPYNIEIRKSAIIINEKMENTTRRAKSKVVSSTLQGISNILRQFIVDTSTKKEMEYEEIYKMKKAISSNGYVISYFKADKMNDDDFLIEIGIRGVTFEDVKEKIASIIERSIHKEVTLEYDYTESGKIYFHIIPKTKCRIEYSTSSIAAGKVSGDNLLVNETKDGKVVSVICDGMGKGYSANMSSEFVIGMFEELFKSNLSSYAMIQMMNTYCEIKDSIDSFCTLDYMELDRKNKEITFYKMSSAPSYIYHLNKSIEKIENKRLPLGKESEIVTENVKVEEGDIIIMSSDGVFENIQNEGELNEYIASITHLPAPKIVYQVINYIKESSKLTDDDISLVVLKVLPN